MEQLKKDNIVRLDFSNGTTLTGVASVVSKDSVTVVVEDESSDKLHLIETGEQVHVVAYTPFGIRYMASEVTQIIDGQTLAISNPPADRVLQKREFLRLVYEFNFSVIKSGKTYPVKAVNFSAGSIGFRCRVFKFQLNDSIKVVLPEEIFTKKVVCNAHIQRMEGSYYVAKYDYLQKKTEDLLAKCLFARLDEILRN